MTNPNYAKFSTDAIKHRYDFLLLFDVTNGNPNGDPDAGNMPRQDVGSGKGFVTPMCIKRKIRNAVSEIMDGFKDEDKAYDIYISQDAPLRNKDALACEYVGVEPDKLADAKKNDPDLSDKLRNFMCANFYDVRTFGAVMTTFSSAKLPCASLRGPVQLSYGTSVDPVVPVEVTIGRKAITKPEDADKKTNELARAWMIPYGLYVMQGHISPRIAQKESGFSERDLAIFWDAIMNMCEFDRATARAQMNVRALVIFEHDSDLGNVASHKLFDLVHITKKDGVQNPRSFEDYLFSVDNKKLAGTGVSLTIRT